jgi:hypothetical protein
MARIALYGGGGAPYHHAAILARAGHRVSFVFPSDIAAGALDAFDAFVMPGGGYLAMQGQLDPLGPDGCRAIREYVEAGGMYIGSCAGAYDAATVSDQFVAACPAQAQLRLLDSRVWNDSDETGELMSPGIGELIAENAAPGHPVMAGMPDRFGVTHYNGPLFASGQVLSRVAGRGEAFTPAEEFLGAGPAGHGGQLLVDRAAKEGVANIVAGQRGAGRVVLFGSHPEFGATLAMDDVTDAARLLVNAVTWQLAESGHQDRPGRDVVSEAVIDPAVAAADLARLGPLADRIAERCGRLHERTADAPWLGERAAMSMFGKPAREIWTAALDAMPVLAAEVARAAPALPEHLRSFRPDFGWPVDGGFHGAVPLLEQADEMLAAAQTAWLDSWPGQITEPYSYDFESPYHLVAGSYLAAIGRVVSAALLSRMPAA